MNLKMYKSFSCALLKVFDWFSKQPFGTPLSAKS